VVASTEEMEVEEIEVEATKVGFFVAEEGSINATYR
jgi:hypothetical protein